MKKDIIIVLIIVLIAVPLLLGTDFQSVDEYYLIHADDITPESETVTVSIDCRNAIEQGKVPENILPHLPEDGVIMAEKETVLLHGDTVFDITYRAVRQGKIQFDFDGPEKNSFGSAYIKGISNLYEFDCGPSSGWVYRVNGEVPQKGASAYKLKNGDRVEWVYTLNLGYDAGGEQR